MKRREMCCVVSGKGLDFRIVLGDGEERRGAVGGGFCVWRGGG